MLFCVPEPAIGNEPFAVLLADDLVDAKTPVVKQLVKAREKQKGGSVLAVQSVERDQTDKYGIVEIDDETSTIARVSSIVEKPKPEEALSSLAVIGRYVLEPEIFEHLKNIDKGAGGEIQLTDAIERGILQGNPTYSLSLMKGGDLTAVPNRDLSKPQFITPKSAAIRSTPTNFTFTKRLCIAGLFSFLHKNNLEKLCILFIRPDSPRRIRTLIPCLI